MTRTEIIETMARASADAAGFAWANCAQSQWRRDAEAALTALEAKGMVVVPGEPTAGMIDAGTIAEGDGNLATEARNIYTAMLAASPTRTPEQREEEINELAQADDGFRGD